MGTWYIPIRATLWLSFTSESISCDSSFTIKGMIVPFLKGKKWVKKKQKEKWVSKITKKKRRKDHIIHFHNKERRRSKRETKQKEKKERKKENKEYWGKFAIAFPLPNNNFSFLKVISP